MARAKTVWGIDIGQCALKAIKLRDVQGQLEVEQFEVIPHSQILSAPEANKEELVQQALGRFLASHNVAGTQVAISVPGQASFSRFVKLPPVETKRIPDIVRFEAEQQIPFPINEVIWRYQTFHDPDSPDIEVGIFAMKKSDVAETLHHFNLANLRVDTVQVAPLALYNFMMYDEHAEEGGATILADVGAEKTDLVIADKGRLWTRTIQIGGNNFTEALVRTFKLSFEKAEELKLSAATSKYARQIFQAMRPVFADLVQEIQRSIGFYTSLHRDTRFKKLVGLGNGFRLPGLQKFMEQNLNVTVARVDAFSKLSLSSAVNAPSFHESVPGLAVAYGLAVQGLEQERVSTNLLPEEIVRFRLWKKKRPFFVAAAVVLLAAMFFPGWRAHTDAAALKDTTTLNEANRVIDKITDTVQKWRALAGKDGEQEQALSQRAALLGYRNIWPSVMNIIDKSFSSVAKDQPMLMGYARLLQYREYVYPTVQEQIATGRGLRDANDLYLAASTLLSPKESSKFKQRFSSANAEALKSMGTSLLGKIKTDANSLSLDPNGLAAMAPDAMKLQVMRLSLLDHIQKVEAFKAKPRDEREVVVVELMNATYSADLGRGATSAGEAGDLVTATSGSPGLRVSVMARSPLSLPKTNQLVKVLGKYSRDYARWFGSVELVGPKVDWLPSGGAGTGIASVVAGAASTAGMTGPAQPDPLMPNESMSKDTRFTITWYVKIVNNGVVLSDVRTEPGRNQYILGKEVTLYPDFDPADVAAASKKIKKLPANSKLTVQEARMKSTVFWYRVTASDAGGKSLGAGWVSGVDVNQQLKPAGRAE